MADWSYLGEGAATMGEVTMTTPATRLDQQYSDPAATATSGEETRRALEEAYAAAGSRIVTLAVSDGSGTGWPSCRSRAMCAAMASIIRVSVS
jgi:hypothetical protein